MRYTTAIFLAVCVVGTSNGQSDPAPNTCRVALHAPGHGQRTTLLYRYDDLITQRTVMIAQAELDDAGKAVFEVPVQEVTKALVRIGPVNATFFITPGARYELEIPLPDRNTPRGIGGTTKVDPLFHGLDPLDPNALTTDLNIRIDAFLAGDLATDQGAGMHAADRIRSTPKDSSRVSDRPPTLFVLPSPDQARIDTFELKLRRFYAEVRDPWFWEYLDYAVGGLRLGPKANKKLLHGQLVKSRSIAYNNPEQLRFLRNFFSEHMMVEVYRDDMQRLKQHIAATASESVMAMFAAHEFLKPDPRLQELLMISELYAHYHGRQFDRAGIELILTGVRERSAYPEHRTIAANMLWDLTAMRAGAEFPSLSLRDINGVEVKLDEQLQGAVCIAITAGWCTHCEVELGALQKLQTDYGDYVRFVVIGIDSSFAEFAAAARARPARNWTWLYAGDDPLFMDALRLRSVPAFFLLNDRIIARNPAPVPSQGMAALFHKLETEAEQENKIKFGSEAPPQKR